MYFVFLFHLDTVDQFKYIFKYVDLMENFVKYLIKMHSI
jgi:hypothetical protein